MKYKVRCKATGVYWMAIFGFATMDSKKATLIQNPEKFGTYPFELEFISLTQN